MSLFCDFQVLQPQVAAGQPGQDNDVPLVKKKVIVPDDWMKKDKLTVPQMLLILKNHGGRACRADGKDKIREELAKLKEVNTIISWCGCTI